MVSAEFGAKVSSEDRILIAPLTSPSSSFLEVVLQINSWLLVFPLVDCNRFVTGKVFDFTLFFTHVAKDFDFVVLSVLSTSSIW